MAGGTTLSCHDKVCTMRGPCTEPAHHSQENIRLQLLVGLQASSLLHAARDVLLPLSV